jgi:hypothetical protein
VRNRAPKPNLLSVFGSDLTTSVYACIMPTIFDCFAKIIGWTCPCPGRSALIVLGNASFS